MISEYGELTQEAFDYKDLTWKVPNIFKLKDSTHNYVSSSPFCFGNMIWELRIFPNGATPEKKACIDVAIASLDKERDIESDLFIQFFLVSSDGKNLRRRIENLDRRKEVVCTLIQKKTLMEKKERLCPNGVLTICCRLKIKKCDTIKGKNLNVLVKEITFLTD